MAQFGTIEVLVAMPMDRSEFKIVPVKGVKNVSRLRVKNVSSV